MSKLHFEKTRKKGTKNTKGFYIALGVCLIAIGAAAWTTYDGVKNYLAPEQQPLQSSSAPMLTTSSQDGQQAGVTVSGVKVESETSSAQSESSAASSEATEPSSKPESEPEVSSQDGEAQTTNTGNSLNIYPASKTVTKEYSGDNPVYSLTMGDWRVHQGIDLAAEAGSVVKAVSAGTVKEIKNDPMFGTTIIIAHNGFDAYYCGLGDTALVKEGDAVSLGDEIGSIKEVPCESVEENHLHFGVQKDGKWINPLDILEQPQN